MSGIDFLETGAGVNKFGANTNFAGMQRPEDPAPAWTINGTQINTSGGFHRQVSAYIKNKGYNYSVDIYNCEYKEGKKSCDTSVGKSENYAHYDMPVPDNLDAEWIIVASNWIRNDDQGHVDPFPSECKFTVNNLKIYET